MLFLEPVAGYNDAPPARNARHVDRPTRQTETIMRKMLFAGAGILARTEAIAAESPKSISPDEFHKLHQLIRPQAGELRFHEIPWQLSVWEARKQAAAEGKPILVWSG